MNNLSGRALNQMIEAALPLPSRHSQNKVDWVRYFISCSTGMAALYAMLWLAI
jgi:hypothetical protein